MQKVKTPYLIGSLLATMILLSGCKETVLQSNWTDQPIIIDGYYDDWQSKLIFNQKKKIGFGIANDSTDLYLCLTSMDQNLARQIMMRGFILTVGLPGAKQRILGVKFPTGMNPELLMQFQQMRGETGQMPRGGPGRGFEPDRDFGNPFEEIYTEFLLLGPGKDEQRFMPLDNDLGIHVNIGRSKRSFVYEIQIPFTVISQYLKNDPAFIPAEIVLRFKTAELDRSAMRPDRDGMGERPDGGMGETGGRRGGTGGGMGGPGGGMGGPGEMGAPGEMSSSSFEFKTKVVLARPE